MIRGRPISQVAKTSGISVSSLKNYKKQWGGVTGDTPVFQRLHSSRILTDEEESAFVQVLLEFKTKGIPVTVLDVRRLCYFFAEKVGSTKIEKWKRKKIATLDWFLGFVHRNPKAKKLVRDNYKGYSGELRTAFLKKLSKI